MFVNFDDALETTSTLSTSEWAIEDRENTILDITYTPESATAVN